MEIRKLFIYLAGIIGFYQLWNTQTPIINLANITLLQQMNVFSLTPQLYYPRGTCDNPDPIISPSMPLPDTRKPASPYLAGLAAFYSGNLQQAEHFFTLALEDQSSVEMSAYALGATRVRLGQNPAPAWSQGRAIERLLEAGDECSLLGNGEQARKYYQAALEALSLQATPDSRFLGKLVEYFARNDDQSYQQALIFYLQEAAPNSLEYHWTLGKAYAARQEFEPALENFRAVIAMTPDDPKVWYEIGQTYVEAKAYDTGREALSEAIKLAPEEAAYYVWMGHSFLYQTQYDLAAEWYEQALAVNPSERKAVENLAKVRIQQKRYQEAYDLALRLMDLDQRSQVRALAAEAAFYLKDWDQAQIWIRQALKLEPDQITYYQRLAQICETVADQACLLMAYQNILRLDPKDPSALQRLEEISEENP